MLVQRSLRVILGSSWQSMFIQALPYLPLLQVHSMAESDNRTIAE